MKCKLTNLVMLLRFLPLLFCLFSNSIVFSQFEQKLISETWSREGGNGIAYKNVTVTDAYMNVYVAGSTISGNNNSDILIQKFDKGGLLLWENTFAGAAGQNDVAADIFVDNNMNVYLTGTVVNSVQKDQDIIVIKYNAHGNLIWNFVYHGSDINKMDAGTAIIGSANGSKIFVTGISGDDQKMYDFKTFSLSSVDGSVLWSQSFDSASNNDVPKNIILKGSSIVITGASQISPTKWELVSVQYKGNSGVLQGSFRSNTNSVSGISEINDYSVDNNGNTYLVGSFDNGATGFDVAVYKLDSSLNLVWENFYDINGTDDKGKGIVFDSGDLYICGYSTKAGLGKETLIMKLNEDGILDWTREVGGATGLNDEGEKIIVDGNGKLYIASTVNDNNNLDFKLYCYDVDGKLLASTSYDGLNHMNDIAQSIQVDLDNNIIVTGIEETANNQFITKTVKYSFFERLYQYEYDGNQPSALKGTIVIRFKKERMNIPLMNSRKFQAGLLKDFVDNSTLTAMHSKTGIDWSRNRTYKVFKNMIVADSLSITRLGDTIRADDLWTFLSVDIPDSYNISDMCDSLKTLYDYITEADKDILYHSNSIPTDQFFLPGQLGLYPNSTYPNADINATGAWDYEVGQPNVKVGIIDAAFNWSHEEFNDGFGNLPGPTQKVGGGYDYYSSQQLHINPFSIAAYDHGTAVAGIVGARRNNYTPGNDSYARGVAGIAGGDPLQNNFGVQLYSLGIFYNTIDAPVTVVASAIRDAYSNTPGIDHDFNYGLHIINASWGSTAGPHPLINKPVEECWRNHCVFVTGRGHFYPNTGQNHAEWPACLPDIRLLTVMASGMLGERKLAESNGDWESGFGLSGANNTNGCAVDIMAPGIIELITTTIHDNNYQTFSGTSAAAPHVTGVAALMYSKHQQSNGYPNNLVVEDIEAIMEKTATDKGAAGFDLESGYGLLNAYEAVKQVSDPYYVKHLTSSPTLIETNGLTIHFVHPQIGNTYSGCKKVELNWDINVTLPGGHEIIDWWEFEAGTNKGAISAPAPTPLGSLYVGMGTGLLNTSMVFNPIGGNQVHKTASTAVYFINSPNGGLWFPMSPSEASYKFSIHVKKSIYAGVEEIKSDNFTLYPNPSKDYIKVIAKSSNQITGYELLDATGRVVAKDSKIDSNEFIVNILSFHSGIYYCKIISENTVETIPFVKVAP